MSPPQRPGRGCRGTTPVSDALEPEVRLIVVGGAARQALREPGAVRD